MTKPTVEEFLEQGPRPSPGEPVSPAGRQFIADMRKAAANGVDYGWMQTVIEVEWATTSDSAWGPTYFKQYTDRLLDMMSMLQIERNGYHDGLHAQLDKSATKKEDDR